MFCVLNNGKSEYKKSFRTNYQKSNNNNFVKKVAEVANDFMREKVWVSVQGYAHVRISFTPKYYFDNELKTD